MTSYLNNRTIAVTSSGRSIKQFSDCVASEGGRVIALQTIEIIPREPMVVEQIVKLLTSRNHDICAFLSSNAVDVLFDLAHKTCQAKDLVSVLNSRTIIAIGPNTKMTLNKHNIKVDIVPKGFSTQGLIEMLAANIYFVKGKRILIPRSGEADDSVQRSLIRLGMSEVNEIVLYDVTTPKAINNYIWDEFVLLLTMRRLDSLIFTSPSSVKALIEILKNNYDLPNLENEFSRIKTIIAIGPRTLQELKRVGIQASTAEIHTMMGALQLARENLSRKI